MTQEELLKGIDGLASGDNAEAVAGIRKEVEGLYATIDAADKLHKQDTAENEKLKKDNLSLYFRVTGQQEGPGADEHEEEETRGIDWDKLLKEATTEEQNNG